MIGLEEFPIMSFFKTSLFLALLTAVSLPAVAQTQIELNIPFNFIVAGKTLPAGHYRVAQVFEMNQNVWSLRNEHNSAFISSNPVLSPIAVHRLCLTFWHVDGEYTLARFWPNAHVGHELLLKPKVKGTMLAKGGQFVEIEAE
jgi:hypothetical protein